MAPKRATAPKPAKETETRPVDQRGKEWAAKGLTGNRAQRGGPHGKPEYTYEVQWAGSHLGCPATSATVERLFSVVGMNYSDKRKSGHADTLEDLAFTRLNL